MEPALKTMIDNMPSKTGKSLKQWKVLLKKQSFEKHGQAVNYLKSEHGVTHGFANTIVTLSKDSGASSQDLVQSQYEGKEALRPIHDDIVKLVKTFGKDVTVTPKKTSVSLIRKKQFALIKPATKTRVDLGLKLVGKDLTKRLQNSGPFGTMCSHRVQLTSISEIDSELKNWLKEAYDQSV